MDRITQYKAVQNEAFDLFQKKNKDYGDSFANFGPIGVIVRMGDKINRLSNITNSSVSFVKTESIRDTLIDLHNYSAMAIMLMDESKTKKVSKEENSGLPTSYSYGHELSEMDDWGQFSSTDINNVNKDSF
jgi:hypothetical protein